MRISKGTKLVCLGVLLVVIDQVSKVLVKTNMGLGEISPDEFRGFIGQDMRLERVTLQKNDAVMGLLEFYMGKNTMERQNFIIDNLVIEEDKPEEEEVYE